MSRMPQLIDRRTSYMALIPTIFRYPMTCVGTRRMVEHAT